MTFESGQRPVEQKSQRRLEVPERAGFCHVARLVDGQSLLKTLALALPAAGHKSPTSQQEITRIKGDIAHQPDDGEDSSVKPGHLDIGVAIGTVVNPQLSGAG